MSLMTTKEAGIGQRREYEVCYLTPEAAMKINGLTEALPKDHHESEGVVTD